MSKRRRSIRSLLVLALTSVPAWSAVVGSTLEARLSSAAEEELLAVVVHLPNQMHARTLHDELRRQGANMAERHRQIMLALQAHAQREQRPFLERLRAEEGLGELARVRPHWIANEIELDATPAGVALLSEIFPAAFIEMHPVHLIGPVDEGLPPVAQAQGHEWGLEQVRAPQLWALGIHGEGSIVANVDTGVDGSHVAFTDRWRGERPDVQPQHAWLAADQSRYPTDSESHGTHTMGTIAGGALGDTVGVAPGADWIAAKMFGSGAVGPTEAFEWCADPDGDPETFDDVPDVVSNSWGYVTTDCVPYDAVAIDNMELMGVVAVFSAGNEGSGSRTIRPPANRADDLVTNFAVGATTQSESMAGFSSRGPTTCEVPDSVAIKPEVSAPGSNVRSAVPGGRYSTKSGTSMASPHVGGAVALIRQIVPELTAEEVKMLLFETARHPGGPGIEDNNYGRGIIDLEAAAEQLFAEYEVIGSIDVLVTDAETGDPLPGVKVLLDEAHVVRFSDDRGEIHSLRPAFSGPSTNSIRS